jgi:hypothetical protein
MKAPQKSLKKWTKQKWRTKSGKPSSKTGERYLPSAAIKSLSDSEYAATTRAKRKGTKAGKQFVAQPKKIADKVRKFRAAEGGMASNKVKCPKCKGKGCAHCGGTGYHSKMNKGGVMAKKPNEGMKALKKAAPEIAKRMGYKHGGMSHKKGYSEGGLTKSTGKLKTGIRGCGDK